MDISIKTINHDRRRLNAGSKTRIFVFYKDETVRQLFERRFKRPVDGWREIAAGAANMCGLSTKGRTIAEAVSWSRKAGCSCGCSPGFILKSDYYRPGFDIYVTINEDIT